MQPARQTERDPLIWCVAIALAFLALGWHRLGIPTRQFFDEVHYVPAALKLLALEKANAEHPLLGKQVLAASIHLLGDNPLGWRLPSLLAGAFGLFAFGRMMWWASLRRFATLAGMVLVATGFAWFVHSRIAMLDMLMAALAMAALWLLAQALRRPERHLRWHLAGAGVLLGLAMGTKWNMLPLAMLPGLALLAWRLREHGAGFLTARESRVLLGVSLMEAALWLGLVPLLAYWLTFWPAFYYTQAPASPFDFLGVHSEMIGLQESVKQGHPYSSSWPQWVSNWRAIWYLYEHVDGAQRGVLLIGNPFTMLAGLAALVWCLWAGIARKRADALAFATLYLATLGLWLFAAKPVQFYYHYLLPGTFLLACLALALDALWRSKGRWQWLASASIGLSVLLFVWFYPILSAAQLHEGANAFAKWMWLDSWR